MRIKIQKIIFPFSHGGRAFPSIYSYGGHAFPSIYSYVVTTNLREFASVRSFSAMNSLKFCFTSKGSLAEAVG